MSRMTASSASSSTTSGRCRGSEELLQAMTVSDLPIETITYSKQCTIITDEEHITFSNPHPRAPPPILSNASHQSSILSPPSTPGSDLRIRSFDQILVALLQMPSQMSWSTLLLTSHPSLTLASLGQEVGIFFHWLDVGERTLGISGAIQVKQETWADALHLYMREYEEGAVVVLATPFPHTIISALPALSATSSEDSIWTHIEDLLEQMSQVTWY
ncbi:hypothetical protein DFJ58DRAFT_846842 [Suillus subalutaceus]|uniref:uncharacterized protein n=1 Tax=Suillus subalutaceus TaxID=48586 RepID=UPI001B876B4D|nr:uncharacterized protein DFJ58DRAFT_846842 [Suillus subalutaceus]KAG1836693.1 hypothetical protein DFJ58DRAFT_846842 [Suillus subalutaceus]